jgi:hypothetical protein
MKHNVLYAATLLSTLGCGLIAGVFFSFSSFVMKALAELPPAQGIAAMQSINVVVINRWFMSVSLELRSSASFWRFSRSSDGKRMVPVIDFSAACSISPAQFR